MNLPLVPFEFFLFSMFLCFAAGLACAFLLFLLVVGCKPKPKSWERRRG